MIKNYNSSSLERGSEEVKQMFFSKTQLAKSPQGRGALKPATSSNSISESVNSLDQQGNWSSSGSTLRENGSLLNLQSNKIAYATSENTLKSDTISRQTKNVGSSQSFSSVVNKNGVSSILSEMNTPSGNTANIGFRSNSPSFSNNTKINFNNAIIKSPNSDKRSNQTNKPRVPSSDIYNSLANKENLTPFSPNGQNCPARAFMSVEEALMQGETQTGDRSDYISTGPILLNQKPRQFSGNSTGSGTPGSSFQRGNIFTKYKSMDTGEFLKEKNKAFIKEIESKLKKRSSSKQNVLGESKYDDGNGNVRVEKNNSQLSCGGGQSAANSNNNGRAGTAYFEARIRQNSARKNDRYLTAESRTGSDTPKNTSGKKEMLFTKSMVQKPVDKIKMKSTPQEILTDPNLSDTMTKSSARQIDSNFMNSSKNLVAALKAKAEQSPNVFVGKSSQGGLKLNNFFNEEKGKATSTGNIYSQSGNSNNATRLKTNSFQQDPNTNKDQARHNGETPKSTAYLHQESGRRPLTQELSKKDSPNTKEEEFLEYKKLQEKLSKLENKIFSMKINPDINSPKGIPWRQNSGSQASQKNSGNTIFSSTNNAEKVGSFIFPNSHPSPSSRKNEAVSRSQNFPSNSQSTSILSEPNDEGKKKADKINNTLASFVTQVKQGTGSSSNLPLKSNIMKAQKKPPTSSSMSLDKKKEVSSSNYNYEAKDRGVDSSQLKKEKRLAIPEPKYYVFNLVKAFCSEGDYFAALYREHLIQSMQAISLTKTFKPIDAKLIRERTVILPQKDIYRGRKTVVFDLDETLIHCNESTEIPSDVILPIQFPKGDVIEAGINIRPFTEECLREISKYFEIIIFTASHSCYANVVLDYLDPNNQYIQHRLFRENCIPTEEGFYLKDLRIFGNRNLKDLLIVDNATYSFASQLENGIPIIPFYENKQDEELKILVQYLKSFACVNDVREENKNHLKFQEFCCFQDPVELIQELYREYL